MVYGRIASLFLLLHVDMEALFLSLIVAHPSLPPDFQM